MNPKTKKIGRTKVYTEIYKLKEMLQNANIPFYGIEHENGYLIHYPAEFGYVCSAIEHDRSIGREKDLIEIMGLLTDIEANEDDCVGNLTAEDVFNRIKEHWEKHKEELKPACVD